jgi:hypothetical protein
MGDKYAVLAEPRFRFIGPLLVAVVVFGLILFFLFSGSMHAIDGVVQTSGAINRGKYGGGTQEIASVRLSDGRRVLASVASGGPLAPGDRVRLMEQRQTIGAPAFVIVGKEPPEPEK